MRTGSDDKHPPLEAPYVLEYTYKRSLGPALSAFFTGLRDRRIIGVRTATGDVIVPPTEHDPQTGAAIDDLVDVGDSGTITTWAWVSEPLPSHPLDRPFAFALIRLDGATTPFLHVVDAPTPDTIATGTRVKAVWAEERGRGIQDIVCFRPENA